MNQQSKAHKVLGIMSGTSLDGVDLCLSEFSRVQDQWNFKILAAETVSYSESWIEKLKGAENLKGNQLIKLHFEYGNYLGSLASSFFKQYSQSADLIASHGHTLFHQPREGFTFQLGSGGCISAATNINTVADFRSLDVALKGEGAPLVPFGDEYLFSTWQSCLNLGGIGNISFKSKDQRIAFDIVPVNMVLNYLCQNELGVAFDDQGAFAREGNVNSSLLSKLNDLEFYNNYTPKSLGKEWVFEKVIPLVQNADLSVNDRLRTVSEHIAEQIHRCFLHFNLYESTLITGGGAYNTFLIELLKTKNIKADIPSKEIVEFKEALIFAFLGLKRFLRSTNTLCSVTGAKMDSSSGTLFMASNG